MADCGTYTLEMADALLLQDFVALSLAMARRRRRQYAMLSRVTRYAGLNAEAFQQ